MMKNIFLVFVLLFVSFSLVACKNEQEVKKNDSMELLIQETQKRSKIEKNKDEIQNLINSISTDLEKNYESREIDIKPDYLLYINGKSILHWTIKDDIVVSAFNNSKEKLVDYHIEKDNENYLKIKNMLEKLTNLVK